MLLFQIVILQIVHPLIGGRLYARLMLILNAFALTQTITDVAKSMPKEYKLLSEMQFHINTYNIKRLSYFLINLFQGRHNRICKILPTADGNLFHNGKLFTQFQEFKYQGNL